MLPAAGHVAIQAPIDGLPTQSGVTIAISPWRSLPNRGPASAVPRKRGRLRRAATIAIRIGAPLPVNAGRA